MVRQSRVFGMSLIRNHWAHFVLLALVVALGIFVVMRDTNTVFREDAPIISSSSDSIFSQTSSSITYSNSRYGFSFAYPREYGELQVSPGLTVPESVYIRQPDALQSYSSVEYRGTVRPEFYAYSVREDIYPFSVGLSVFREDRFRFNNASAGLLFGYDATSESWWQDDGVKKIITMPQTIMPGDGWTAYRFGMGDAGASLQTWAIPLREKGVIVSLSFDTSVSIISPQKTFAIEDIVSSFQIKQ